LKRLVMFVLIPRIINNYARYSRVSEATLSGCNCLMRQDDAHWHKLAYCGYF
jgi:hypothetical protein